MDLIINNLGIIIYATLLFTPPLLFAAMGSCFSELSGGGHDSDGKEQ